MAAAKKSQFTEQERNEIARIQAASGTTRKNAIKKFHAAKKAAAAVQPMHRAGEIGLAMAGLAMTRDNKSAAANDDTAVPAKAAKEPKPEPVVKTAEQVSANRREGIRLFQLAGKPKPQDFVDLFGPTGIKMTWQQRGAALGLSAEQVAAQFQKLLAAKRK